MAFFSSYTLRLICGAILTSLLLALTGTAGPAGRLRRTVCGIFLLFLAISPLREIDLGTVRFTDPALSAQADRYVKQGSDQAKEAMATIISDQCSAYILNKAAELELDLTLDLRLNEDTGAPAMVTLSGDATPYQRQVLTDYITQTLGLERSCIQWMT